MKIPYRHRDGSESKEKGRLSERERESMRELVEKKWVMNSRKESERGRQTHEYDTVCNFMVKREKKLGNRV